MLHQRDRGYFVWTFFTQQGVLSVRRPTLHQTLEESGSSGCKRGTCLTTFYTIEYPHTIHTAECQKVSFLTSARKGTARLCVTFVVDERWKVACANLTLEAVVIANRPLEEYYTNSRELRLSYISETHIWHTL
jgi:hypothetical protein